MWLSLYPRTSLLDTDIVIKELQTWSTGRNGMNARRLFQMDAPLCLLFRDGAQPPPPPPRLPTDNGVRAEKEARKYKLWSEGLLNKRA
jgi:hypothetical protein